MVNRETETPRATARRGILAAHRAVVAASKLLGQPGCAKTNCRSRRVGTRIRRRDAWSIEFDRFARHHGVPTFTRTARHIFGCSAPLGLFAPRPRSIVTPTSSRCASATSGVRLRFERRVTWMDLKPSCETFHIPADVEFRGGVHNSREQGADLLAVGVPVAAPRELARC